MTLPIYPVTLPSDLAGQSNGQLPAHLLKQVHARGLLHRNAARGWAALVDAAAKQGLPLTFTYGGMYRDYAGQETLFRSRYAIGAGGGGCKSWDSDGNGSKESWCKKSSNLATAAVPGTSNHGWGLAIDTAFDTDPVDGLGPDDAAYIAGHPQFAWFRDNIIRFGFSFELQSEPWHIRWVAGDSIPQAVLDFEAGTFPPPRPPSYHVIAVADKLEFAEAPRWDTRGFGNPLPAGEYVVKLQGSDGKVGAKVNLAIANMVGAGFGTAWSGATSRPDKSAINWNANTGAIANQIDVALAPDGSFKIYINSPAHIIIDLVGYWS
jgi:LAS superfamily LD-carboxypeptidase LdcB